MAFLFSAPEICVKVGLERGSEALQFRKVTLPHGASTSLTELVDLLQVRFGESLARKLTYEDAEGDCVTISTDQELGEALTSAVRRFIVKAPTVSLSSESGQEGDWEVLSIEEALTDTVQWQTSISFWVNGVPVTSAAVFAVTIQNPDPGVTLLDWLREENGTLGAHLGCGEGGCGICTVALVLPSGDTVPINSCLRKLCAVDGCHVINSEGIGSVGGGMHEVQKCIADGNGSQCGFCTPGWVMHMYTLLQKQATPSAKQVEQHFDGNLCRCTGYRPILSAFGQFAKGGSLCGSQQNLPDPVEMAHYNTELKPLHFQNAATGQEYFRPTTLDELAAAQAAAKSGSKELRFVCATTGDGVRKYLVPASYDEFHVCYVDVSQLPDLLGVKNSASGIEVGAAVSIELLIETLLAQTAADPAFGVYAEHLKRIASVQIRAVGSWAGNVMLCRASSLTTDYSYFTSDMVLVLATAGAKVTVSVNGVKQTMDVLTLMATEGDLLLVSMFIPATPHSTIKTYKMMQRHVFAHAIVNMGINLSFGNDGVTVATASVMVGGATSHVMSAKATAACLIGKTLTNDTLIAATRTLISEIDASPATDKINSAAYRKSLACGFLYKYFLHAQSQLPDNFISALVPFTPADARPVSSGSVAFGTDPAEAPLGEWIIKAEAAMQATGEARYVSDVGVGSLFSQIVLSNACNSKLISVDPAEALKMPGVKAFISASDIPAGGQNFYAGDIGFAPGLDFNKDKIFWQVGDARLAAKKVVQTYGPAAAPVLSMERSAQLGMQIDPEQTIAGSMHPMVMSRLRTNPAAILNKSCAAWSCNTCTFVNSADKLKCEMCDNEQTPNVLVHAENSVSSTFKTGAQQHMPLETNSVCVVPIEADQYELHVGGQWPDLQQAAVSLALNIKRSKINAKNTRVGGGFGGKILWQLPTLCAVAVAAHKLRRAVRYQSERSDNMQMTGLRTPMDFAYTASFDATGKLGALELKIPTECGWVPGFNPILAGMASGESDNVFHWPGGLKATAQLNVTNKPTNTPMRAPGTMQAALFSGAMIDHVARTVGKDLESVIEMNMYNVGDITPFGDTIGTANLESFGAPCCSLESYNWTVPLLWSQIQTDANFAARKQAVADYNAANRWTKKGISLTASKWNMKSNQYNIGCLLTAFADGTVHVSVGGVEIGQGLNTKVALCVAQTLGIPLEDVRCEGGDTFSVPNGPCTGGSGTSEACSNAAIQAATTIKARVQPFLAAAKTWQAAVLATKTAGISVSAEGWFSGIAMEPTANIYGVFGTAVTEVRVEQVDLLMDLGNQMDAAVDIGQVQGAFVQVLGYLLTEECKWDEHGKQMHLGTWEYKIPTAYDIPVVFNTSLLKDSPNPNAIAKSSKAVAEPAMSLITSPYLAVKNAIYAARKEVGLGDEWFNLNAPITPEAIRNAVNVPATQMTLP